MGAAKMKRAATTAEIQKPVLALSAGHVSIGNPFGPSVVANANAAGGTMVPKADLILLEGSITAACLLYPR